MGSITMGIRQGQRLVKGSNEEKSREGRNVEGGEEGKHLERHDVTSQQEYESQRGIFY